MLLRNNQKCITFGTIFKHTTFDEEENGNNTENEAEAASDLAEWEGEKKKWKEPRKRFEENTGNHLRTGRNHNNHRQEVFNISDLERKRKHDQPESEFQTQEHLEPQT